MMKRRKNSWLSLIIGAVGLRRESVGGRPTVVVEFAPQPVHRQENLRLKFAFGTRSRMFVNTDYTDHKKFTVQTDATIDLPPLR